MESRWNDRDAQDYLDRYGPRWGEGLALRVYSSHLIGRDAALVLHGGGNTSVKVTETTLLGDRVEVLRVKGSGWELDRIEPPGFPAVDLAYLRRLRGLRELSDEEMVNQLRTHLFDASAPTPSVEALLHAFLPHRYIDHTHADVALILTNQPADEAKALAAEAFGPRWAVVPYVMPGLLLAQVVADAVEAGGPELEGVVLCNHGLLSFGDDARTSYERMIAAVDRAEMLVARRRRPPSGVAWEGSLPQSEAPVGSSSSRIEAAAAQLGPWLRGALVAQPEGEGGGQRVVTFRSNAGVLEALERPDAEELAASNPLTPDHVIRTKGPALWLPGPLPLGDGEALRQQLAQAVGAYRRRYQRYFDEQRGGRPLRRLDPSPRVVLARGLGLFATGPTLAEAQAAADIAERTLTAKAQASDLGSYRALSDADLFAMEYWSLEQAKLGKGAPALGGRVALVTGACGAIGSAVARALVDAGAHVVVTDREAAGAEALAAELDPGRRGLSLGLAMDVTDEAAVERALGVAVRRYGGLDVLVLNAGVAHVSPLEQLELSALRRAIDVNLVGTFLPLRAAARLFRAQGTGGSVVLNASKNVFAPGAEFGAYSATKAAGHQLAKVAALELAPLGVRVNMINADGVFGDERRPSGLWREVGPARAQARGLSMEELPEFYRKRNLLHARVTAQHVARAVLFFASEATPTTGATLPIDGGLPEAFPR